MSTATLRSNRHSLVRQDSGNHGIVKSIEEIVASAQAGDPESFRELYDVFHQNTYRLMVRMVGLQEAEDLTQQVFLQVFRKLAKFSSQAKFSTWLYRLAINESLQYLRIKGRSHITRLEWEPEQHSHAQESFECKECLERALAAVDPELRAVFLLREVEEMSYTEIAEVLHIPSGTVGSRLNKVRRELQCILTELGAEV